MRSKLFSQHRQSRAATAGPGYNARARSDQLTRWRPASAGDGEMLTMARGANEKKAQTSTAARRTASSTKAVAARDPGMSRRPATRAKVRQSRLARNKGA